MDFLIAFILGVLVFLTGQLVLKLVIEPFREFTMVVAEIEHNLLIRDRSNCNYRFLELHYSELKKETNALREHRESEPIDDYYAYRELAGKLVSSLRLIPFYSKLRFFLRILPPKENVIEARICILDLASRSITNKEDYKVNATVIDKIKELLHLEVVV